MFKHVSNFWGKLSKKQKIIISCLVLFFGFPFILVAGMFALVLTPFIAIFAAIIFLILALIKRDKMKQFGLSSIGAVIVAFATFFLVDVLFTSETTASNSSGEVVEEVVEQVDIEDVEPTYVFHPNETINKVLTELNNKYGIILTEEEVADESHENRLSFELNEVSVLISDTEQNLFVEIMQETKEDNNGPLIETFRQLMSALSPFILNDEFNTLVAELQTFNYQHYKKYIIDHSMFTLDRQELENQENKYTLKGQFNKSDLFTDSTLDYMLTFTEENEAANQEIVVEEPVIKEEVNEVPAVEQILSDTKIHFIDTGHSDSVLIENNGQFALIDAGDTDDDAKLKTYLKNQGVSRLEYLIVTHFHADHFGAADTVVSNFEVGTTLVPNGDADTQVYRDFINALANKGLTPSVPLEGAIMPLGNATLTFYNTKGGSSNENNDSLVTLLQSGSRKALFTGDAESQVEATLTNIGDVDLFKAGHHGSNTSNTASLLNRITPEHVVVMAGTDNQYGHPDAEVMNRFESLGIPVYRTDEQGTIIVTLSDESVSADKSPGSYKSGSGTESSITPSSSSSTGGESSTSSNTASNEGASTSTGTSETKDDNPNGIYSQESTAPKESYKNCTLLREVYPNGVPEGHPAYASKHDRDKDGWACER